MMVVAVMVMVMMMVSCLGVIALVGVFMCVNRRLYEGNDIGDGYLDGEKGSGEDLGCFGDWVIDHFHLSRLISASNL